MKNITIKYANEYGDIATHEVRGEPDPSCDGCYIQGHVNPRCLCSWGCQNHDGKNCVPLHVSRTKARIAANRRLVSA